MSACGDSPISEMWMSTRVMRSKGKGASVRNTDVFPRPRARRARSPRRCRPRAPGAPATASASLELCIVVSPEVGIVLPTTRTTLRRETRCDRAPGPAAPAVTTARPAVVY